LQEFGGLVSIIPIAVGNAIFGVAFRNLSFGHRGRPKEIIFLRARIRVQLAKRPIFAGFSKLEESPRGAIFKAAECLVLTPYSWYIGRVKQVISDKLLRPLGTVSTLKKWEEPVHR
jgi:hypothetical protein